VQLQKIKNKKVILQFEQNYYKEEEILQAKLKWNAIGFESKTILLLERLTKIRDEIPNDHSKKIKKIQGFIAELSHLIDIIGLIKKDLIPRLENLFRLNFKTPELIMLALSRPSIRHIYENVEIYFRKKPKNLLKPEEYKELASSGDAGNVLALIGDSVIDLAIVQLFWDSSLSTAGSLSKKRQTIVSNENLAKLADKYDLYSYRLKRLNDPSEKKSKEKTIKHFHSYRI